jgi:hypothetical protein
MPEYGEILNIIGETDEKFSFSKIFICGTENLRFRRTESGVFVQALSSA